MTHTIFNYRCSLIYLTSNCSFSGSTSLTWGTGCCPGLQDFTHY
ncbi:hypothetical protein MtrunA17_Chr4g0024291 [Medicago truncatula]|uniref:Uncharacterized protein n=1 Tax=Medicago truncatula TaxID=3880 RepID=A0A396I3T1_MEDTR|nr:hypothetical protein MtrunA17_Chr4g0024291 [Medicago truncatula]